MIRFLSVCSGIEAASQALHARGFECAAVSEIEPHPCAVLAHRFGASRPWNMPDPAAATNEKDRKARAAAIKAMLGIPSGNRIPNYGDMSRFQEWPDADYDALFGGTPCQSFSVAGLRAGLDDPRGNLMLTFGAIAARFRPRWVCWENVPGVLSSNDGRDFASLLGLLSGRSIVPPPEGWQNSGIVPGIADAYGLAWCVLDAQYVRTSRFRRAVPQRRRRVFVVGYSGDWRRAAAVLFDAESLRRDPPPSRSAGQRVAPTISARPTGGGGLGTDFELDGGVIATSRTQDYAGASGGADLVLPDLRDTELRLGRHDVRVVQPRHDGRVIAAGVSTSREDPEVTGDRAGPLGSSLPQAQAVAYSIQAGALRENPDAGPDGVGVQEGHAYTLEARAEVQAIAVAFDLNQITSKTNRSQPDPAVHHTLPATSTPPHLATPWFVRRLTPVECERLMGMEDGFTNIPWRGRDSSPDGNRYKELGNSWALNSIDWIGERMAIVDGWP